MVRNYNNETENDLHCTSLPQNDTIIKITTGSFGLYSLLQYYSIIYFAYHHNIYINNRFKKQCK